MSEAGRTRPDPRAIHVIPKARFARLPDPSALFPRRAGRFHALAAAHDLAPYLSFLGDLAEAQAAALDAPAPGSPDAGTLARAARHGMPPLNRSGFAADALAATFDRLLVAARRAAMPDSARAALDHVAAAGPDARRVMVANALADAIPFEAIAEHALTAAALQVVFARLAAGLDPAALKPIGDGVCPACGAPPVASLIRGWEGPGGVRYCACSLCGTLWNVVRAKCTLCGSTADVSLRSIDGGDASVKAECCGACRGYVKVLYQEDAPELDPVADDVASLGLDLLLREQGFRRGAVNPFLTGY